MERIETKKVVAAGRKPDATRPKRKRACLGIKGLLHRAAGAEIRPCASHPLTWKERGLPLMGCRRWQPGVVVQAGIWLSQGYGNATKSEDSVRNPGGPAAAGDLRQ